MKNTLKIISIIILVFAVENTYSQSKKFQYELEFTPKISFRTDYEKTQGFDNPDYLKPITLFDAGINVKYSLSDKNTIGCGLFSAYEGNSLIIEESDYYNQNIMYHFKYNIIYNYLELPIFTEHIFAEKIILKTGLIYKRVLSLKKRTKNLPDSLNGFSKDEYKELFDKTYTLSDLKKYETFNINNLALLISLGQNFDISENLYLGYGIEFKSNLLPIFREQSRFVYYFSTGINLKIGLK